MGSGNKRCLLDLTPGLIILGQTAASPSPTPENSLPEVALGQESEGLGVSGILLSQFPKAIRQIKPNYGERVMIFSTFSWLEVGVDIEVGEFPRRFTICYQPCILLLSVSTSLENLCFKSALTIPILC